MRLTRQTDHARLAADLAKAFADVPEPREAFLAAVAHHDDGWDAVDDAPLLDASTGLPHDYRNAPRDVYRAVWRRSIDRALERGPYVGLLVGLHGLSFIRPERDAGERAFHDAERARQNGLLAKLGFGGTWDALPETPAKHLALLQLADALSLFACEGWSSPWRSGRVVATRDDDGAVRVAGAGLSARVVAGVPCRLLPQRAYHDVDALRADAAKATAAPQPFAFTPA